MEKKNIELTANLLNRTFARPEELGGYNSIRDFVVNMKNYDFGEVDCITLFEVKYGPNIHVAVEAGYDIFTYSKDGITSNDPRTDKKHYYVQATALGDNEGSTNDCLKICWLDDDYPDGITYDEALKLWDDMFNEAYSFIKKQVEQLPYVWVVALETSDESRNDEYEAFFSKYEDAKAFFDKKVTDEKNPETSWAGEVYEDYKNGTLEEGDYEIQETEDTFTVTEMCEYSFVSWTLRRKEIF